MFTIDQLDALRAEELQCILSHFPPCGSVLEIGAGTGGQALALSERGFDVSAIDLTSSAYAGDRVYPVRDYDGKTIPFEDDQFDVVYSSNTLEHVRDLTRMHREIARVLKPGGLSIHVLPSNWWRLWTTLAGVPATVQCLLRGKGVMAVKMLAGTLLMLPHGERGNALTELWSFRPSWWKKNFTCNGFNVLQCRPVGLFYTGCMLAGRRLGKARRKALSRHLGSASFVIVAVAKPGR